MTTKRKINIAIWSAFALFCDIATIVSWAGKADCPTQSIVVACLFYTFISIALCWSIDEAIKENEDTSGGSLKA